MFCDLLLCHVSLERGYVVVIFLRQVTMKLTKSIEEMIYLIRGCKVILDEDLARLYAVDTRILVRAVRRNLDRFPSTVQ